MTPMSARPDPMTMPSLATRISNLARDVREIAADHVELAVLEAQQAGIGLAKILCGAVVISILLVTAWLALVASAIVWATSEGVSWTSALIIAAVINIVAGAILAFWMKSQVGELLFSATLRQLRGDKDTVRKELQ
jgi:uncharacterized membrane protein YqjE